MRAWPKAFEYDPILRKLFVTACELLSVYGDNKENLPAEVVRGIPAYTVNYVWSEARKSINL